MERPSGSLISYMSSLVKTGGGINCAQGIPGFNPPAELIEELKICSGLPVHQYAHGNGVIELRDIISAGSACSQNIDRDNVLITNGATEAISLIYLYLKRKKGGSFTTLAFDPVYESYSNLPRIYGDRFIPFEASDDGSFDLEHLENTVKNEKVDLVILCSPGNPFGKIWSKKDIIKLHGICSKQGTFLIFDYVYSDIYFNEAPYLPYELIDERTFFVSAFSKMLSITGWRVGYLISSKNNMKELVNIHDYTGLCAPSILQNAVCGYLRKNDMGRKYLEDLRDLVKRSFDIMHSALDSSGFKTPSIDGGYFIWTEIPPQFDNGFDFAIELYEKKKVGTVPGIHFSKKGNKFIRISIARNSEEISEAAKRIREFIGG